jgi:uncharacterized membrane protein
VRRVAEYKQLPPRPETQAQFISGQRGPAVPLMHILQGKQTMSSDTAICEAQIASSKLATIDIRMREYVELFQSKNLANA